ncbi:hypothetical protein [Polaromonas sp. CG9_12]|nr:hypothetical protein [Polaromonas sp. CG9_12]
MTLLLWNKISTFNGDIAFAIDSDPSNDKFITIRYRDLNAIFGVNDSVAQPENGLVGVMYHGDPFNGDIVVSDATSWVYAGTGASNASRFSGLLGYETDTIVNNGYSPPQLRKIAESPDPWGNSHMATYTTESGSVVFATGSNQWSWGIDNYGNRNVEQESAKQATRNVLARFGAAPVRTPTNVQATAASQAINLSWTAPIGATAFNLYRSLAANAQGTTAYRAGLTSPSFTDTGLAAGTTYFYTVTGANTATESAQSAEVSAAVTSTSPPPASNPAPILSSIAPTGAAVGGAGFSLTARGSNFVPASKVYWNGTERPTSYLSVTQLSASIPASDLQSAGTAQVSVVTPAPGGGVSAVLSFTVNSASPPSNPAPTLSSLSPTSAAAGSAGFALTVNGSNFVAGSKVYWNGAERPTSYLSATQLSASIPATDTAAAGAAQVSVFNPTPGGGVSSPQSFTVTSAQSQNLTQLGSIIAKITAPKGGGSYNLNLIRDGVMPPMGNTNSALQYDTFDGYNTALDDWIGYQYTSAQNFNRVVFQEGRHFSDGGWFKNLTVQVRQAGTWVNVSGLSSTPAYPGTNNGVTYETYTLQFAPISGEAIRIYGAPGGSNAFISVAELQVYGEGTPSQSNPVPVLSSLSPTSAAAGSAGFALTVNGSNFVAGSKVYWNGTERPTSYLSATQLSASIPASDLQSAGTAQVSVVTPAPGGGVSAVLSFTVNSASPPSNPAPTLSSLSPTSAAAGSAGFALTVNGSNFVAGSKVYWNGAERPTSYLSATQLSASIPATDTAAAGAAQVSVFNPTPGGGVSSPQSFTVTSAQSQNLTQLGSIIAKITAPKGGGSYNLNLIRDGVMPPVGNTNSALQYDTFDGYNTALDDWIGYQYTSAQNFNRVVFQEGRHFSDGGWFKNLTVQVRQAGTWVNVSGLSSTPAYPGTNNGVTYETYTLQFAPISGEAIRIYGAPGGSNAFISVAELQVYGEGTPSQSNPVPVLSSLSPTSAAAGSAGFALTVNGSNFVAGSKVYWNGTERPTSYLSATQLSASIPASDLQSAGTAQVSVVTPAPGGGVSAVLSFTVNSASPPSNPAPTLSSLSPTSAAAGSAGFALTVNGSNFVAGSRVYWNGTERPTSYLSATQLSASIPASDLQSAGTAQVSVVTPAPGGGVSAVLSFTVNSASPPSNPAPTLSSLSPTSAAAGSAGFALTVNGSNFVAGSRVYWNGAERPTSYLSATQLSAAIPATDTAAAGAAQVSVFNPTPGGGVSSPQSFTVTSAQSQNLTQLGSIIAKITAPKGGGSYNLNLIRDGVMPPVGNTNSALQYDTFDGYNTALDDWIGYQYTSAQSFNRVVFQEGRHFSDGGWFKNLTVQVRQAGTWVNVSGLSSTPAYPGTNNGVTYETYTLQFAPISGEAIRIYGAPGGSNAFISVAELQVYGP